MPRIGRVDIGEHVYHIINRSNARVQIFDTIDDYQQFEAILNDAVSKYAMRLLAYCIMPNHWHFVLHPRNDGDLGLFMGWLSTTHTRRWHTVKNAIGHGHLYQGRYRSFLCEQDGHFLTLVRYVERNAKKANLVQNAEDWRWSSVWRRKYGSPEQKKMLSAWPIEEPEQYLTWLNQPQTQEEEDALERSTTKDIPFGSDHWIEKIVRKFGLEQTLRGVGRPKNDC